MREEECTALRTISTATQTGCLSDRLTDSPLFEEEHVFAALADAAALAGDGVLGDPQRLRKSQVEPLPAPRLRERTSRGGGA